MTWIFQTFHFKPPLKNFWIHACLWQRQTDVKRYVSGKARERLTLSTSNYEELLTKITLSRKHVCSICARLLLHKLLLYRPISAKLLEIKICSIYYMLTHKFFFFNQQKSLQFWKPTPCALCSDNFLNANMVYTYNSCLSHGVFFINVKVSIIKIRIQLINYF